VSSRRTIGVRPLLALVAALACPAAGAWAAPAHSTDRQRYRIEATLDAESHTLSGWVQIHLPNTGHAPVRTLELHLYANAFAHDATVFMHEEGYALRDSKLVHWGGTDVGRLQLADGTDLLATAETELLPGDRTQLRVQLPRPLQPGESLELTAVFRTRLPNMVARSGYRGDLHMIAQWFPKLAKLRPDGTWVGFPYHGMGEFHADFADYRVTLDVPSRFLVAGSGRRTGSRVVGQRRVDTFEAPRVHDVAFVAGPNLARHRVRLRGVDVEFIHPPGYEPAMRRQRALIDDGLGQLGEAFGRYPWKSLTVLIPPAWAQPVSAMEYPTFIVTGGPWWAAPRRWPHPAHDLVTVHELAHQWFQGAVASDELNAPFLDEGLTQWVTIDLLQRRYARLRPLRGALGRGTDLFDVVGVVAETFAGKPASSLRPAHTYDQEELARAVYVMPPLVIETVSRVWGRARLLDALGHYARAHRFAHPTLADLFTAFDQAYWPGFAASVLKPALDGQRARVRVDPGTDRARPLARRTGGLPLPLQVRVAHATGNTTYPWPASQAVFQAPPGTQRLVVDPARRNLLDRRVDLRTGVDPRTSSRQWWSHLVFWLQQLLMVMSA